MEFLQGHLIESILVFLLALSELLGSFDFFKNSSVFSLVVDIIKKAKNFLFKPKV